jgi:NitT/TauT family transport system substrate-binding protein
MVRRILIVLGALMLAACGPAATPTATPPSVRAIRLPMGYIPSVQYAPFYVADDKGYFKEAGLDITFDYSFETNGVQLVGVNELPFAVVSAEQVLLARAQGLPVVYVLAWFQKFPVAVIAKSDSGVVAPADLRDHLIGLPTLDGANFIGLRALMAASGLAPEETTLTALGFNQAPALAAGQVDAVVVYANNEPIRLAAQGEQLTTLLVSDYVTLAANGLLTNETMIQNEPELVRGFVQAFTRGLADTLANPEEAYAISQKYVEALTDDALEKQVLAATLEMWKADRLGYSDPAAWETMQKTLLDTGLLAAPQDLGKAYTNQFVP